MLDGIYLLAGHTQQRLLHIREMLVAVVVVVIAVPSCCCVVCSQFSAPTTKNEKFSVGNAVPHPFLFPLWWEVNTKLGDLLELLLQVPYQPHHVTCCAQSEDTCIRRCNKQKTNT